MARPPTWQRHPVLFASGLSVLTLMGLVLMLSDATAWKVAGFAVATVPALAAATGYLRHRR